MKKLIAALSAMLIIAITVMSFSSSVESSKVLAPQLYEYVGSTTILPGDGFNATEISAFVDDLNFDAVSSQPQPCTSTPKLCSISIDPPPSAANFEAVLQKIVDYVNLNGFPGAGTEFTVVYSGQSYKVKIFLKA